MKTVARGK